MLANECQYLTPKLSIPKTLYIFSCNTKACSILSIRPPLKVSSERNPIIPIATTAFKKLL